MAFLVTVCQRKELEEGVTYLSLMKQNLFEFAGRAWWIKGMIVTGNEVEYASIIGRACINFI